MGGIDGKTLILPGPLVWEAVLAVDRACAASDTPNGSSFIRTMVSGQMVRSCGVQAMVSNRDKHV